MIITKADGSTEEFKVMKLRNSLRKAGATKAEIALIVARIKDELHDGMKTQQIYRNAFTYLRENSTSCAARYSLRRALFSLGPTGFPFEDFLAKLFEAEGYTTKTRIILSGNCAKHEIDVAAYNEEHSFVAEAKFHARPGIKSDLQVAMYSYARSLDLQDNKICTQDICGIADFWLITNTKFTSSAEQYGNCVGLKLLSWDFPRDNNLHDRIRATKLWPVTVLTSLSGSQKRTLLERGVILCRDIAAKPQTLSQLHISSKKTEAVLSEVRQLTQTT